MSTTTIPTLKPHIRWMIRRDMPEVIAIEKNNHTRYDEDFEVDVTSPICWQESDFLSSLRKKQCIGMVAELGNDENCKVLGYMVYDLGKGYLDIVKFDADYTSPMYEETLEALMKKLKEKLSPERRTKLLFVVPDTELNLHLFLKKHGFVAKKVKRNYFETVNADGYCFKYQIEVKGGGFNEDTD